MLTVTLLPNQRRPSIGRPPNSEARRPWLPQHARHCPVLEAGSALGFLIYPPLQENESYQVRYLSDNSFRFSFFVNDSTGKPDLVFAVTSAPSAGGGGLMADDLMYRDAHYGIGDAEIQSLKDALIVNLDTPPGAVGLRGAWDFRTPEGWDTVYTGVLNQTEPPHVPVLSVRVQTDWYAHNTEFRYVLQPGEAVSAAGTSPIGQVFFVPREDVKLQNGAPQDVEAFRGAQQQYWQKKAGDRLVAPYGLAYSPHYRKVSRANR
ncbi:MAG: hypothetical protein ACRDJE_19005 [Dehalococcoidia bacterium]